MVKGSRARQEEQPRSFRGEKAEGIPLTACTFLQRNSRARRADLSLVALSQMKFTLDFRKRFFTQRVLGHLNKLPREVVMAPSLSEIEESLGNALCHVG